MNPIRKLRRSRRQTAVTVALDTSKPAAVWADPHSLVPWPGNPRKAQPVAHVAESIRRYGFGPPIVARESDRMVAAGHTRLKAALELGLERVPVRFMPFTDAQFVEFALSDNIIAEEAKWDTGALGDALGEVGDDLPEWLKQGDDEGTQDAVLEDITDAPAEFYLTVRGPVPMQPDAIERLRAALAELPGCDVEVGIT